MSFRQFPATGSDGEQYVIIEFRENSAGPGPGNTALRIGRRPPPGFGRARISATTGGELHLCAV